MSFGVGCPAAGARVRRVPAAWRAGSGRVYRRLTGPMPPASCGRGSSGRAQRARPAGGADGALTMSEDGRKRTARRRTARLAGLILLVWSSGSLGGCAPPAPPGAAPIGRCGGRASRRRGRGRPRALPGPDRRRRRRLPDLSPVLADQTGQPGDRLPQPRRRLHRRPARGGVPRPVSGRRRFIGVASQRRSSGARREAGPPAAAPAIRARCAAAARSRAPARRSPDGRARAGSTS
jgi:hypothetical protein